MHDLTLRGPVYTFRCYALEEAKTLGLVDAFRKDGTHSPVSSVFSQGEGQLLEDWLPTVPDAILIETGKYQITVYRPKNRVLAVPENPEEETECE